jgi:hypothetical protein
VHTVSSLAFEIFNDFWREADGLAEITTAKELIRKAEAPPAWTIVDGFILHNDRVFVPLSSALWPQLLATAHGAGHEGVQKTLQRLRASF